MKLIPLTQGQFAMVDDEDYDSLIKYKWSYYCVKRKKYAVSNDYSVKPKKTIRMHRLILGISDSKTIIDHIDHNGLNNQKNNLRLCSSAENSRNSRSRLNTTSNFLGVHFRKDCKKWRASVVKDGIKYPIGHFLNEIDAAKAYDKKAIELFGTFANLNFKQ